MTISERLKYVTALKSSLFRGPSQLRAQALHQSAESFVVSLIPPPLTLLDCFDQSGFGQYRHVMRDGRLRQLNSLFDISGAKAGVFSG
jgi:hypothetical protein